MYEHVETIDVNDFMFDGYGVVSDGNWKLKKLDTDYEPICLLTLITTKQSLIRITLSSKNKLSNKDVLDALEEKGVSSRLW
jgi:hypothetical protein